MITVWRWHTVDGCVQWMRLNLARYVGPERAGLPSLGPCIKAGALALAVPLLAGPGAPYGGIAPLPAPYVSGADAGVLPGGVWGGGYGGGYGAGLGGMGGGLPVWFGAGGSGISAQMAAQPRYDAGEGAGSPVGRVGGGAGGRDVSLGHAPDSWDVPNNDIWDVPPRIPPIGGSPDYPVPEPGSLGLLALGVLAVALVRRRR